MKQFTGVPVSPLVDDLPDVKGFRISRQIKQPIDTFSAHVRLHISAEGNHAIKWVGHSPDAGIAIYSGNHQIADLTASRFDPSNRTKGSVYSPARANRGSMAKKPRRR